MLKWTTNGHFVGRHGQSRTRPSPARRPRLCPLSLVLSLDSRLRPRPSPRLHPRLSQLPLMAYDDLSN